MSQVETPGKGGTHPRRPRHFGRLQGRGQYRAHSKTWRGPHGCQKRRNAEGNGCEEERIGGKCGPRKRVKTLKVDLGSDLKDRDVPNQGRSARFGLFHENKVGLGELFSGGGNMFTFGSTF